MGATVSIRLPDELTKHLDEIARETERPRSFHIQKAILRDPKDIVISGKDLRQSLGL
jgi:RHH-type rel operon transcriptional repressor/antitoxin RelB